MEIKQAQSDTITIFLNNKAKHRFSIIYELIKQETHEKFFN